MRSMVTVAMLAATLWPCPGRAQDTVVADSAADPVPDVPLVPPASSPIALDDSASPFGTISASAEEIAALTMPVLAFTATPADEANYEKYYYFNRPDTDFATAYADLCECDGYARGLSSGLTHQQAPYPYTYTMAGAVGGMIGNAMAMAIFGSAEKRRLRRVNMRKCMSFKGYERYGLSKELWEKFNFEEGLTGVKESDRKRFLQQQALVASSHKPTSKGLGL